MGKTKRVLGFAALMIATFLGTLDTTIVNISLVTPVGSAQSMF
jgi:hypothetical protein